MNKEKYIKYANKTFKGEALKLILNQIELFYSDNKDIVKNSFVIGEEVFIKKGTFIHGIKGGLENLDWTVENGFISSNFSGDTKPNKFFNNVGMWNIQKDILLSKYIKQYSGLTIGYNIGRGPGSKFLTKLIPYRKLEKEIEAINNSEEIWMWNAVQTKEIRFIPSLAANKVQIAFILNMESEYANKMRYADIFNEVMTAEILKYFIVDQAINEFINNERNSFTTDRESAIMFGLPIDLVEGVLVGSKLENNLDTLKHIKYKLPSCYICNLEGKVIY